MKSVIIHPFSLLGVLCFLLFNLAVPAHAQNMVTNDVPDPFPTLALAGNTNILSWGNSGGVAAGNAIKFNPGALGMNATVSFQCATVTLALVTFVLQGSVDNALWHNVPNGPGAFTISIPASASTANNTNVVFSTNFTQAACGNFIWWRLASKTNNNSVNLTSCRTTLAKW